MLCSLLHDGTQVATYLITGTNPLAKKILLQVLRAHRDEVWFLQFSNNGKYLASASNDKSAIIWKVATFITSDIFHGGV